MQASRSRSTGAVVVAILLTALCTAGAQAETRPNVVILLADDLGFADVGYRGSPIATPAIDRLAEEGVRLERFYSAPICSPTRAALMTGRDPLLLGLAYDQIHPWYNVGLAPETPTIARAFKQAGYRTGIVGKWHLGHTFAHQLPGAQGFEHFHGHLHTNTDYFEHVRESGHDLQRNGKSVREPGAYLTHIQAREAVRFIEQPSEKPFLLYVPFTAPHSPMQAPEATIARYEHLPRERYRRVYAAMVHEMDAAIAAILGALDERGIADRTLVLFFSDNGGSLIFGADNTPLRGQKGQTFEGGLRVPAVMRWPGELPGGSAFGEVATVMDVYPTLAAAAGVPVPAEAAFDGQDLWPAIRRGETPPERAPLFFASEIPLPGVIHTTVIDWPWKLVQVVREGQTRTDVKSLLFRLDEDPNEEKDLSAYRPQQLERLAGLVRGWRSRHPMAGTRGTLVAHPGWVAPKDWADAVLPARLLQPRWKNELPFSKALLDATAERGVLVDEATRAELLEQERLRTEAMSAP